MTDRPLFFTPFGDPLPDALAWARLFETADRMVAQTFFVDGLYVSTVYLGLDHNHLGGPPLIYETAVFDDGPTMADYDLQRYSTLAQAWRGHWQLVALVTVEHGEPTNTTTGVLGQMAQVPL